MIQRIAGRDVYVAILSARHPTNATDHRVKNATWHVPSDESLAYLDAGAPHVALGSSINCAHARNTIIDAAHWAGVDVLWLDDDLKAVKRAEATKALPSTPEEGFETIVSQTIAAGASLGTSAYNLNAYFLGDGPDTKAWGNPGVVGYMPSPILRLRQDTRIDYAEDFDFALQHYVYGKGFVVNTRAMFVFKHKETEHDVERSNRQLMDKWAPLVRVNPKTGNLTMPKPKAKR